MNYQEEISIKTHKSEFVERINSKLNKLRRRRRRNALIDEIFTVMNQRINSKQKM